MYFKFPHADYKISCCRHKQIKIAYRVPLMDFCNELKIKMNTKYHEKAER